MILIFNTEAGRIRNKPQINENSATSEIRTCDQKIKSLTNHSATEN